MKEIRIKKFKAFTLLEILLVVAAIAILAAIVILAINPSKQIEDTQNAKRASDTGTIFKALNQYAIDNSGDFPEGLSEEWKMLGTSDEDCNVLINDEIGETSTECLDLYNDLVPTYLANMPIDPTLGTQEKTYYAVSKNLNGRIAVKSLLENESGNNGEGDEEGDEEEDEEEDPAYGPDAFVMEFSMSAGELLTIPLSYLSGSNYYNAEINWGDGSDTSNVTSYGDPDARHTYLDAGNYEVYILGDFSSIPFANSSNKSNLISIIQWGDMGFTTFDSAFKDCFNLSSLPDGPITGAEDVINFNFTFSNNSLTEIPNGLFDNTPNATYFRETFSDNSITSIPEGLFDYTPNVTNFQNTFENNSISSIPEGLFDNTPNVSTFFYTFNNNYITSIPEGLFDSTPNVSTFNSTFSSNSITSIPEGLFDNTPNVGTFSKTFSSNSITSIPVGLFDNNSNVYSFSQTFYSNNISSIPEGLFDNNSGVTSFYYTFNRNSLTSIPDGLFDSTPNVTSFEYTFYSNLTLTGNAPELWLRNPQPNGNSCFRKDTSLSNYDDIPSDWK